MSRRVLDRVFIDATAVPAERGGVGRYVDDLLPALAAQGVDLVVGAQSRDVDAFAELLPAAEIIAAPAALERRPVRMAWEQTILPRLVRSTGSAVLHCPHYTMPWLAGVPVVVTLHDATFFSHPELHTPLKARFFRSAIRTAVRRADALVVPSGATGAEVRRFVGGRDELFHVAFHGVDSEVFYAVDAAEQARVRETLDLVDRDYVAFLGTLEPRKNVPALIRGWVQAVAGQDDPPVLVLAGGRGWDDAVDPAIEAVPQGLTVLRPGYLPLADLPGFLAGAKVLAYPSLGEGFGLPVLEAMACGAAVLTTRELSLTEVGGDAVEYCDTDADSIAEGLRALLADDARRAELSAAAITRAAGFTWEAAATVHIEAFEAAQRRA